MSMMRWSPSVALVSVSWLWACGDPAGRDNSLFGPASADGTQGSDSADNDGPGVITTGVEEGDDGVPGETSADDGLDEGLEGDVDGNDDAGTDDGPVSTNDSDPSDADATADEGPECVDGSDCDDGDPCTVGVCTGGDCSHAPRECDDGIACTMDACDANSGACVHAPDHGACADADACNGDETCDLDDGCVEGTPVSCNDGTSCTADSCDPQTGACTNSWGACNSGDGCCPPGCTLEQDDDCNCINLAPTATPTMSQGGQDAQGYGPSELNDGVNEAACDAAGCQQCFAWVQNSSIAGDHFFQLQWSEAVTIGSMVVQAESQAGATCGLTGRNVEDGRVQWWTGSGWQNATTWSNQTDDLRFEFDPPLVTTRVRLYGVTHPQNGAWSRVFEWFVYGPPHCQP